MLCVVVPLLIILCLDLSAKADESTGDLSWVKNLNLQAEKFTQSYQEEARAIVNQATSAASQQKHCKVAENLAEQAKESVRHNLELSDSEHRERYSNLLVFVSFSMPLETLKTLAHQVNQLGGNIVFRGLVNSSFKQTAERVKGLQQEVIIDPTLFEDYQIEVVPTFILRSKKSKDNEQTDSHKDEPYDRLVGNVSLEYVLDQFSSLGTTRTEAIDLLTKLRNAP